MQLTTTSTRREAAHESTTHSASSPSRTHCTLHATLSRALHSEQASLLRLQRFCLYCSLTLPLSFSLPFNYWTSCKRSAAQIHWKPLTFNYISRVFYCLLSSPTPLPSLLLLLLLLLLVIFFSGSAKLFLFATLQRSQRRLVRCSCAKLDFKQSSNNNNNVNENIASKVNRRIKTKWIKQRRKEQEEAVEEKKTALNSHLCDLTLQQQQKA